VDACGITRAAAADTLVARFNDAPAVAALLARLDEEVAAIIVEPVATNMGVIAAAPSFLPALRDLCDRAGALLVFDEVVTGFRLGPAGASGAVIPDLGVYGKVAGGGTPIGAVAGQRGLLSRLAPAGPVFHAGTFAGNAVTMSAGLAQFRAIEANPGVYERLDRLGASLEAGLVSLIRRHGYPCQVARAGSLWSIFFTDRPVVDAESARGTDASRFARFFHAMLRHGIHLTPSPGEANFLSAAHSQADVARTLEAAAGALKDAHE
jgi:glutamate-1-semialdehyde 2,1-aminomutase